MRFKEIDSNQVSVKIEPNSGGFYATALAGSEDISKNLRTWGDTREEAVRRLSKVIENERLFEPDVDSITDRHFARSIFVGNGNLSYAKLQLLHQKLDKAYCIIGGMEQNGGMGTQFDEESHKQDSEDLKSLVDDIITALK